GLRHDPDKSDPAPIARRRAGLFSGSDQWKRFFSWPHDVLLTGVGFTDSRNSTASSKSRSEPCPGVVSSQHSHHEPVFWPVPLNVSACGELPGLRASWV